VEDQLSVTPTARRDHAHGAAVDVAAIGAFDMRYQPSPQTSLADIVAMRNRIEAVLAARGVQRSNGTEHLVDGPTMVSIVRAGRVVLRGRPGGAAYESIVALAGLDVRLGAVAVAGRVASTGRLAGHRLPTLGVDCRFVRPDPKMVCGVSVLVPGLGTLITPGANAGMAAHLAGTHDELVGYLAGARVVHVTPPLDPATLTRLRATLAAVRQAKPAIVVTVDPGFVWAACGDRLVWAILRLADIVLLTYPEFCVLGAGLCGDRAGAREQDIAAAILADLHHRALLLVRHPHAVTVWTRNGATATRRDQDHHRPADDGGVDVGQGGGVFAAGLIAGLIASPRGADIADVDRMLVAARLGMLMAHHSLRHPGARGHAQFAGIAAAELSRQHKITAGGGRLSRAATR
jgi:sugar/nucleoside kinase (ribokinase family)